MPQARLFRWVKGRLDTGYDKLLLAHATRPIRFDLYLLRFPPGVEVPAHTDAVRSGRHFRLNIVLRQAKRGGHFYCERCVFESRRIKLFRPDLYPHSVSRVEAGTRLVVSLGWIRV